MERKEALRRISELKNVDLRLLADEYEVTVFKDGKKNKGWAGHVIERFLGLAQNSSRSPNFGSWELKVIPLYYKKDGTLAVKETMAITMIDQYEVRRNAFRDSHLYNKLQKILIVSRIYVDKQETSSLLHDITEFDLNDPKISKQVEDDYELIRKTIIEKGFLGLSGKIGTYIQPRTKGQGHGSTSRAFYARKIFLEIILGLNKK
ncbi:MAG: MutH/Sau3AI family endonuclease [Bacteroidota bacterium]